MSTENSILQLLSNPDTAAKLSGIISSLKSDEETTVTENTSDTTEKNSVDTSDRTARKIALIKAIKPFLDEKTQQKADIIIAFLELSRLISGIKNDL